MSNTIKITAVDNELIVLAYHWTGSYELCRILSGNGMQVNVTLTLAQGEYMGPIVLNAVNNPLNLSLNVCLPVITDKYSLLLAGINWGGPAVFAASVNGTALSGTIAPGNGVVWTPAPIAITI